ncbi:CHASE sensor domain-containing protein, partial [Planctomycetota bacterium]
MVRLKNLTIKQKLTWITMVTSTAALLLAGGAFIIFERINLYHQAEYDISIQSEMIAESCKAFLDFGAADEAGENLALLRAAPSIVSACIFDNEGNIFAQYKRDDSKGEIFPASPERDGSRFEKGYLVLFKQLDEEGEKLGTLYMLAHLEQVHALMKRNMMMVGLLTLGALALAYILSARLQKLISRPISNLVATTKMVSESKDYSVRAHKDSEDEVGLLIDSFNAMLG